MLYIIPMAGTPAIAVLGTLDTKGEEAAYLAQCIRERGHEALLVDIGLLGVPAVRADISREDVARASPGPAIDPARDRQGAMGAVAAGAAVLVDSLWSAGRLGGVVAIGGSKGTWIATSAMRQLPWGVPKMMVAATVTGDLRRYAGHSDLIFQSAVVDLAGLNPMTRTLLGRAAAMITAAVSARVDDKPAGEPVALTMAGVVTPCGQRVDRGLRERGYEPIILPANGVGGLALEEIVNSGRVGGVIELALLELSNEVVGGVCAAGADRLESAARRGLPQVVVPGAVDFGNFAGRATIPDRYRSRQFVDHTPAITLMRLTPAESRMAGELIAARLGRPRGLTEILIPMRGFSSYDQIGGPFHDDVADQAFIDGLRSELDSHIPVQLLDEHVNDPGFADAVVAAFERVAGSRSAQGPAGASEKSGGSGMAIDLTVPNPRAGTLPEGPWREAGARESASGGDDGEHRPEGSGAGRRFT